MMNSWKDKNQIGLKLKQKLKHFEVKIKKIYEHVAFKKTCSKLFQSNVKTGSSQLKCIYLATRLMAFNESYS